MAIDKYLSVPMFRAINRVGYEKAETAEGLIHYFNGNLHRVDGPAIERRDGTWTWFLYGKRHRDHGPANQLIDGTKDWWINGERHREDGPAIEFPNGEKKWFLHGLQLTEDQFHSAILAKNLDCALADKPILRKMKI